MKTWLYWVSMILTGGLVGYLAADVITAIIGGAVVGLVWSLCFLPYVMKR